MYPVVVITAIITTLFIFYSFLKSIFFSAYLVIINHSDYYSVYYNLFPFLFFFLYFAITHGYPWVISTPSHSLRPITSSRACSM